MKKVTKRIIIAAVCVVVAGGVGLAVLPRLGAGGQPAVPVATEPEEAPIPVNVEPPQTGSLQVSTEFIGRIQPNEVVNIIPKMAGTVLNTYFEVGDTVRKGDLLFEFDDSDLATIPAQMALAEASYNYARLSAERALGSQLDLQLLQVDSSYKTAKNSYESAAKSLSDYVDDFEPNVDKLEDALDDLRDARDALRDALKKEQANEDMVKKSIAPLLEKAEKDLATARKALEDYVGTTIGTTSLNPSTDTNYQSYKAQVDVLSEQVERYQKQIAGASTAVSQTESAIAQNESLYQQTKTQYNNAKDGYDTQVDQLRTAVKNAGLGLETTEETKDITEGKAVDETKDSVDASLVQAKAQYDATMLGYEQQLKNIRVTSPIDGVVELKSVESHAMASQSSPAYVISNKDIMVVKFNVSSSSILQMSVGDAVQVESAGVVYDGQIVEISSMVDQSSGLFPVKARVDAPAGALLTGVAVKVTAETQKTEEAVLIPIDSVYHEDEEAYVYVLTSEGRAKRTVIETGITDDETIEVVSGLSATDKVITSWNPNLLDGAKVIDAVELAAQQAEAAKAAEEAAAASSEAESGSSSGEEE